MKEFKGRTVIITGDDHGIGKAIKEAFRKEGATVYGIDLKGGDSYHGDVGKKEDLDAFVAYVLSHQQRIDFLINNAPPLKKGISECSYEEFEEALRVGVVSAFYLSKCFRPYFTPESCIINISSTRDSQSQSESESYAAAKGGLRALTHALALSLQGKCRVNSISPGWIDTESRAYEGPDALQQPAGRVGVPDDIAQLVLFLCSSKASLIDGKNIVVDGGMSKTMIYHDDYGWTFEVK